MIFKLVMSLVIDEFLLFCALRPCRQQKQIGAAFTEPEIMTFCISLQTRENEFKQTCVYEGGCRHPPTAGDTLLQPVKIKLLQTDTKATCCLCGD